MGLIVNIRLIHLSFVIESAGMEKAHRHNPLESSIISVQLH